MNVRKSNPGVRTRHIVVNGQLKNSKGNNLVKIVKKNCPTLMLGLRSVDLKKGATYAENDEPHYQHITTALGYGIMRAIEGKRVAFRWSYS